MVRALAIRRSTGTGTGSGTGFCRPAANATFGRLRRVPIANLTKREREVAMLVAQGLTNREIAATLFIAERTAESHLEQIRRKLELHSRVQVAAWVAADGLDTNGDEASGPLPAGSADPPPVVQSQRRLPRRVGAVIIVVAASASLVAGLALARHRLSTKAAVGPDIAAVAGTGQRAFSGDGRQATVSPLVRPVAVAVGADGEVYIAEGNRVRKLSQDGRITTLAGTGTAGSEGDGGPATRAELNAPQGLTVDSVGNVYIAETLGNRVRVVRPDGVITTTAGTGEPGYAGDGKRANASKLNLPTGLAIVFDNSLLIADTANNVIRKVGRDGVISTVAGTGEAAYRGDGGPAFYAAFHAPGGIAFDDEGNLYVGDTLNERIRRIDVRGQISTVAGTGEAGYGGDGGPAISAELNLAANPLQGMGQGLAVGPGGEIVVADAMNHRIRRLRAEGLMTTVARTKTPLGVAVDPQGTIYVADADDNRVLRISSIQAAGGR
jgi:DNA-binding CsgD family transcriptional regulator/sugar lactone lactonase YvrE